MELFSERYLRNQNTLDLAAQSTLAEAKVLIVGLGGLGGYVLEHLARVGVGNIIGCDPDVFETSNLNRQLLCLESGVKNKNKKAFVAQERLSILNSQVNACFFDTEFTIEMLQGVHLVLDCLGGAKDRAFLHNTIQAAGIPLITASVAGWSFLASTVLNIKSELDNHSQPLNNLGVLMGRAAKQNTQSAEESIGTIVSTVNMAACVQSAEAIRLLTGQTPSLINKLLIADLSTMSFRTLNL